MIYEFFYLHDEIEWLDVKLHESSDIVDKFVVGECAYNCLHRKKPLHYYENRERFAQFKDKIIHVVMEDRIVENVNMVRTRLADAAKGLKDCKPNDIVIVTDPDVVLKRSTYDKILASNMENHETSIICDWYFYYMNGLFTKEKFLCTTAFLYKNTVDGEWETVNRWKPVGTIIHDGGWHFSKIGSAEKIADSLDAYPHGNCDYPNLIGMEATIKLMQERIDNGYCWEGGYPGQKVVDYIPYNPANYPRYVNENPQIFSKYFKGGMNV